MLLKNSWIEVFRSGKQTDSAGNTKEWTNSDLDKIVENYNNQAKDKKHEAPIVIGHPETNAPAFGWVETLKRQGDVLLAKLKQLTPQFVEWVKAGHYKKRSISLDGNYNLRHIGFLGAAAPAVKGLEDVDFSEEPANMQSFESENNGNYIDYESSTLNEQQVQTLINTAIESRINNYKSENDTRLEEIQNQIKNKEDGNMNAKEIIAELTKQVKADFSEEIAGKMAGIFESLIPKIDFQEKPPVKSEEVLALEKQVHRLELRNRLSEYNSFAKDLIREGKIVPAQQDLLIAAMEMGHQNGEISFSENDSQVKKSGIELIKDLITSFPVAFKYHEQTPRGVAKRELAGSLEDYNGHEVDEDALVLDKEVKDYMAAEKSKGNSVTYEEALYKVMETGK